MNSLLSATFQISLLRNSAIQIVWWIVFFPGFFSADSFSAVQMARTGVLGNAFTAPWALYVRIFSFHGHAIALLTLINGLVLVYSITRFTYAIFSLNIAAKASFILTLTPIVSGMGITLWHDILMTSGLILISTFFIGKQKNETNRNAGVFLEFIPGVLLASFRPNGLPTILVFGFFYGLFQLLKQRSQFTRTIKWLMVTISSTAAFSVICSYLFLGLSPINASFAKQWMQYDISCYANSSGGQGFVEKFIPEIGSTKTWKSIHACTFLSTATITSEEAISAEKFIIPAWLQILKSDPQFIFKTHLERHAYLNPIPIFGVPTEPFLHSDIEFKDLGIKWAFPVIADQARLLMRIWNASRALTGWAGFWIVALMAIARNRSEKNLVPCILMSLSLMSILFVTAPIPDGRYVLFVLITAQVVFIGHILERFKNFIPGQR